MTKRFPEGFLWGTATSSFQVEMGRGSPSKDSDWWAWVHDDENIRRKIVSGDTPEDGPGSWELYEEDFRLAKKELGNNAIRISIDWARIFPNPTTGVEVEVTRDEHGDVSHVEVNEGGLRELQGLTDPEAVEGYREILQEAKRRELTVILTLYHWIFFRYFQCKTRPIFPV
ncbi:glycoside hydrolase family 1 protein, partial [Candidatus Bathyarchaeota archaeon]|nr:glycoside hydrolase family 1 protein [Candidatus Bathyarchaeota archaeon]